MSKIRVFSSLLKPWVTELTLQLQGTLVVATRGPDHLPKEDVAKDLVRAYRATILNNARALGPENTFQRDGSGIPPTEAVRLFLKSTDHLNYHWLQHFKLGAEVVGYLHPNPRIRDFWIGFYNKLCDDGHHNPETKEQMLARLKNDGPANTRADAKPCEICGYRVLYTHTDAAGCPHFRCENCAEGRVLDAAVR